MPSLPTARTDVALASLPSPTSGRWGFVRAPDGDVLFDDTGAQAVVTAALDDRGAYPFDLQHGSDLAKLRSLAASTPSQAEAMVREAEAPLVRDGTVATVSVVAARGAVGQLSVDLDWTPPGGPSVGVTVPV